MSKTKLINLRTGDVRELHSGDALTLLNEFGVDEVLKINFALECSDGPWSLSFCDKIVMVFNGAFVPDDGGDYRCLSFRRIQFGQQDDVAKKLLGTVVAHRVPMTARDRIYATIDPDVGLASVYHDRPTFTVEFADGKRTVDADECVEATKDQQIAYWRERALNACSLNEDS